MRNINWFPFVSLGVLVLFVAAVSGLLWVDRYDPFSADAPYTGKIAKLWVEPRSTYYYATVDLSSGGKKIWATTRDLWGMWNEGDYCRFVATERVIRSAECFVEAK